MTRRVLTVVASSSILQAANIMLKNYVSGLPVVDRTGKLVGILSQGDFSRRAEIGTQRKRARWLKILLGPGTVASDFVHERGRKVEEVMTLELYTVTEDATLEEVVQLMEQHNVKRLPVMRGDQLVGIVTRSNLLQVVAELAREVPDPTADDNHIRNHIIASIEKADWGALGLGVIVRNGHVHLSGIITNERFREVAMVAAENVSGVTKVHDHLCWVDPMSGAYLSSHEDEALLRAN
jgi:CBS domain-containing protein